MQKIVFDRLKRIDALIQKKGTGTPAELAARIGMSERSIYGYLDLMRELGAPIDFDHYRQSYYYKQDGKLTIAFLFSTPNDTYAPAKEKDENKPS